MPFEKVFELRWGDIDANLHLRNTAYSEFASDVRFSVLKSVGLDLAQMRKFGMGPVLFSERLEYLRELRQGETARVTGMLAGASADGRKWRFRHQIFREDGKECARVEVDGAWIDMAARKVAVPPAEMKAAIDRIERTPDCVELE